MLEMFSVLLMLVVAYAHFREGIFTAFTTLINVIFSGLVAFNFWEPLADLLDPLFRKTILEGMEDFLVFMFLFCVALGMLRLVTNNLANRILDIPPAANQWGGAAIGLVTGYFTAGFFLCLLQTLPWHDHFLGFQSRSENEAGLRRYLPPDRIWLSLVRGVGVGSLARAETYPEGEAAVDRFPTFDPAGTFELRYSRYRRYADHRFALPYFGECDWQLGRLGRPEK
jgi:uncharacterized membrane protein required for colicin V production